MLSTSTFRHLSIFHYITPSVLTHVNVRFKHAILSIHLIQEKLGLPVQPKMPMLPFFKYMTDVRASVVAQHPKLRTTEHLKLLAKMWKSLDDAEREKYYKAYQKEAIVYQQLVAQYDKLVTDDDKRRVKEKRKELQEEIAKRKYVREQRKKASELEKPKKPTSAFIQYLAAHEDRQPNEMYYVYLRRKSSEWKCLSESQKEIYQPSPIEMQNYVNNSLAWKGKMIKLGKYNVIRSEMPNYVKFDTVLKSNRNDSS